MGVIITTKCKNCSLEKKFFYGGGFDSIFLSINSNDKETINECRESFSVEARKAVLAAISAGKAKISIFSDIYKCYKCGNYQYKTCRLVKITNTEEEYRSDGLACDRCGATMKNLGDDLPMIELRAELNKCPLCGHNNEVYESGLWD